MKIVKEKSSPGFTIGITTGYDDEEVNIFTFQIGTISYWITLPYIIKHKSVEKSYEGNHYIEKIHRQYSITTCDEMILFYYGDQPGCWIRDDLKNSDKVKCFNMPWAYTSCIRHSCYDINGNYIFDVTGSYLDKQNLIKEYEKLFTFYKTKKFVDPFDNTENEATINIEEMEWNRGTSKILKNIFKLFFKPYIRRYIEIEFKEECGKRKKSWKGGVIGMSFNMNENESIDECWDRFVNTKLLNL